RAKFGGTKFLLGGREPLPMLVGEVPYTFEQFGGGHHGFYYGQFNGEEKFDCIGPHRCTTPHPHEVATAREVLRADGTPLRCRQEDSGWDAPHDTKDACPFTFGDFAYKGSPDPNQPPPDPSCPPGQPADLGPDGCAGGGMRRFGPMDGNIVGGHPCFTG